MAMLAVKTTGHPKLLAATNLPAQTSQTTQNQSKSSASTQPYHPQRSSDLPPQPC